MHPILRFLRCQLMLAKTQHQDDNKATWEVLDAVFAPDGVLDSLMQELNPKRENKSND